MRGEGVLAWISHPRIPPGGPLIPALQIVGGDSAYSARLVRIDCRFPSVPRKPQPEGRHNRSPARECWECVVNRPKSLQGRHLFAKTRVPSCRTRPADNVNPGLTSWATIISPCGLRAHTRRRTSTMPSYRTRLTQITLTQDLRPGLPFPHPAGSRIILASRARVITNTA